MSPESLSDFYRGDIACLNRQGRESLGAFVHARAEHNGRPLGLSGYRAMLEADFRAIPDLRSTIALLVSEPPRIASRLAFEGHARGRPLRPPRQRPARALRRKRLPRARGGYTLSLHDALPIDRKSVV